MRKPGPHRWNSSESETTATESAEFRVFHPDPFVAALRTPVWATVEILRTRPRFPHPEDGGDGKETTF
jgi:hypothetical protein